MEMNFPVLLGSALVPLIIGFIWYNPKVFGAAWMKAAEMTEEKMQGANMGLIFGLSFVLSILLAMGVQVLVIHQFHIGSILMGEMGFGTEGSDVMNYFSEFMGKYGNNFRTFKHGVFHGVIDTLFIVMPILATNAMFERKGFKYIAVNVGYWAVTLGLMGGIICQWG